MKATQRLRESISASAADSPEALFFELALGDLTRAADLFAPLHRQTGVVDGWVSLEVSLQLAAAGATR